MDNALLIASIGVGGTISAVILTAGFNWLGSRRREARQRRNIRKLLGLENDYNLEGLRKVWEAVTKPPDVSGGLGYSTDEEAFVRRHRLATQLIQPWAHLMWQSNAQLLADALDRSEMNRTYSLHMTLDMFDTLRAKLKAEFDTGDNKRLWAEYKVWRYQATIASQQSNGQINAFPFAREMLAFNQSTASLWDECTNIYGFHEKVGNPIQENVSTPGVLSALKGRIRRFPKPKVSWEAAPD